jgi:DNA-binding HxlR family transcriptional regulator
MSAQKASDGHRSRCPIHLALEVFGDRWTLLLLRDLVFGGRRHFREFLKSPEGISSNILADRVARLQADGIITRADDPSHAQKGLFSLTEKGIQLVPILVQIASWGLQNLPDVNREASRAAVLVAVFGKDPTAMPAFLDELRETHLGVPLPRSSARTPSVSARLQTAFEKKLKQAERSSESTV